METYERVLQYDGHQIRVTYNDGAARVFRDGVEVSTRAGEGVMEFRVIEGDEEVAYDVMVLTVNRYRLAIGRKGRLIFSDLDGMEVDQTGAP